MSEITEDRRKAAELPEDDVVGVLYRQHARIRELFSTVLSEGGALRKQHFDELRALLAAHETGEEMVLRPVSRKAAGSDVTDAVNAEEDEANHVLADLEKMDVSTPQFEAALRDFEKAVNAHAEHEERAEFPAVLQQVDAKERQKLGQRLLKAEKLGPTHPHPTTAGSPTAQWMAGPFASLMDRARDAFSKDD